MEEEDDRSHSTWKLIRAGNTKDIDKFAVILDMAVINLEEAGRH